MFVSDEGEGNESTSELSGTWGSRLSLSRRDEEESTKLPLLLTSQGMDVADGIFEGE